MQLFFWIISLLLLQLKKSSQILHLNGLELYFAAKLFLMLYYFILPAFGKHQQLRMSTFIEKIDIEIVIDLNWL